MPHPLSYHDKYGQYSIWTEGQILCCAVQGVISEKVAKHFDQHFCHLANLLINIPWAYYADMSQCDAYTREAANCIKQTYQFGISHGCVMDAYQIRSALLINQSQKFREALGINSHIQEHIFADRQSCINFLTCELEKANNTI